MIKSFRLEMNKDGLPSLARFKKDGTKIAKTLEQPVLVSINICNLKYFNEIYGTAEGDWLISYMVQFYCFENPNCVLATKSYVDHILILCEGYGQTKDELISKYESLGDQFLHDVNDRYHNASIHIICGMYAIRPDDDFLIAQDNARYARRSITNSYTTTVAFYTDHLREDSLTIASVIPNFEQALAKNEIIVLLQPKYSVRDRKVIGAEALSRFYDPNGEIVSPTLFVPVLEDASIVSQLDFEVIKQIVPLQKRWMEEGRELFPISVNLSRVDFLEYGFIEKVDALIESSGIPKSCIEFELTETAVVEN